MGNFEKLGVLVIIILAVVIMIILIGGGPQEALEPEHERARDELIKLDNRSGDGGSTVVKQDPPAVRPIDNVGGDDWPVVKPVVQPDPPIRIDVNPPVPPTPVLEDSKHMVKRGENPYNLAEKYYGTGNGKLYRKILEANPGVTASNLSIGVVLTIPHRNKVLSVNESSDSGGRTNPAGGGETYVVQKGDSLWKIAERTLGRGSDFRRIQEANRDVLAGGTDVSPGMELRIPR